MINLLPTITKENMRPPLESYISVVNITGKRVWVKNTHKNPKFGKVRQVPTREFPTKFPDWDLSYSSKFGIFVVFFK